MNKKVFKSHFLSNTHVQGRIQPPADPKGPPLVLLRNPVLADQP